MPRRAAGRPARRARRVNPLSGLPWDVWALLALMLLSLGWGVFSLLQPAKRQSLPAILGHRETGRPTPTPAPPEPAR